MVGIDETGALTGYYTDDAHALTEAEMDEIIAHGKSVGVEIIPHLNMPGHMRALLDAMDHVGIEDPYFYGRVESDSSLDLTNEEAMNFMYALLEKYAAYFAERGVKYFHIGADEYANDAYNGNMGFPSMGAALYAEFSEFVNNNAAIVNSHGMTPRVWNDGIYYTGYTAEFDSDIEVTYWSNGWWGYNLAKAQELYNKAYDMTIDQGLMDEDDVVEIKIGTPNNTATFYNNGYEFLVNNYTEAVKGTKLEGKLTFSRDDTLGNAFSDALKNNQVDMLFGVGWTGSALDPYGLMEAYIAPSYQYDDCTDFSAINMTVDLKLS